MGIAEVLLNVLTLVKAGFEFEGIVEDVQAKEAAGMAPVDISAYIKSLRDKAITTLQEELAPKN